MEINGDISILINYDHTEIIIRDRKASIEFVTIKLTPEQLSQALSRLVHVECDVEVKELDKVGKKHENKLFVFEITDDEYYRKNNKELGKKAQSQLSDGWIPDYYFNSQNSFFKKDGKHYARCTIRRWV